MEQTSSDERGSVTVFQNDTYSVLLVSASEKFNSVTLPLLPVTDF